jgi:hypothetical protein
MQYEKIVPDYNFGTILRQDARRGYAEDNGILVTRVQFLAIEVSFIVLCGVVPPLDRAGRIAKGRNAMTGCFKSFDKRMHIGGRCVRGFPFENGP